MGKRMTPRATADLEITVDVEATRTVVHLAGEIDAASSGRLRAALGEAISADRDVVIDLAGVGFIDSSGLGVLVGALRRFELVDRRVILRSPRSSLQRVLDMTGLAQAFSIEH